MTTTRVLDGDRFRPVRALIGVRSGNSGNPLEAMQGKGRKAIQETTIREDLNASGECCK